MKALKHLELPRGVFFFKIETDWWFAQYGDNWECVQIYAKIACTIFEKITNFGPSGEVVTFQKSQKNEVITSLEGPKIEIFPKDISQFLHQWNPFQITPLSQNLGLEKG